MQYTFASFVVGTLLVYWADAQLSGRVGPLTTIAQKIRVKQCGVLGYGGKNDGKTDIGPAIIAAFNACKSGGVVIIPEGDYVLDSWVDLKHGNAWALQLDGRISRTGTSGGTMITIENSNDFELFSTAAQGAVQGNGYVFHRQGNNNGPRILRLDNVNDFSMHDVALVDSPSFHLTIQSCSNGEVCQFQPHITVTVATDQTQVYNMAIRGADKGGLDGIDVWGTNMHIHDIMVTNRDECVTVKTPANNILVENIYCNWSGGCAFGSLGLGTAIWNVIYRNVYTVQSNQMMLIKSNGGSGYVSDVAFKNFLGHSNAYNLDVDQYWPGIPAIRGDGVRLDNITFKNWAAVALEGTNRPPVRFNCADGAPCLNMWLVNVHLLLASGLESALFCRSGYGSGACLRAGKGGSYSGVTTTVKDTVTHIPTMVQDLKSSFGTTAPIPLPSIGPSFFPGVAPLSRIATKATE